MTISFAVLLIFGREIYHQAPPIPEKVFTSDGKVLFTGNDIREGQNVWQSIGGHELGTVALAWFIFGLKGGWSIKK
jgi:nitric oxide reductase subunit B